MFILFLVFAILQITYFLLCTAIIKTLSTLRTLCVSPLSVFRLSLVQILFELYKMDMIEKCSQMMEENPEEVRSFVICIFLCILFYTMETIVDILSKSRIATFFKDM